MGMFDNPQKGAMGGMSPEQIAQAQQMAQQAAQAGGYGDADGNITMANSAEAMEAMGADRAEIEAQADEQNRILTVGSPATLTITGKTDTGEKVAGNPVYVLHLSVVPEGGDAYTVDKREILSSATIGSYVDGASHPGRVDPADPQKVAFGERPWK